MESNFGQPYRQDTEFVRKVYPCENLEQAILNNLHPYLWLSQDAGPIAQQRESELADLRAELREKEKEIYRQRIRAEIAIETDEIGRQCLEHSLSLIDDPDSPWNQ
jgi:hypothetical protein